jgi:hypothetical protein
VARNGSRTLFLPRLRSCLSPCAQVMPGGWGWDLPKSPTGSLSQSSSGPLTIDLSLTPDGRSTTPSTRRCSLQEPFVYEVDSPDQWQVRRMMHLVQAKRRCVRMSRKVRVWSPPGESCVRRPLRYACILPSPLLRSQLNRSS